MSFLRRSGTKEVAQLNPQLWGITRSDLDFFEREVRSLWREGGIRNNHNFPNPLHDDPEFGPNIHQVNEYYIQPVTLESRTSWALMRNPGGLKCDVFVTHCWNEGVFEFTTKVKRMFPHTAKNMYVCFLSNPQNGDISSLLGESPLSSPFAVALKTSRCLLVVPNGHSSIYTRLWCVYEMHVAKQHGLDIRLPTAPGKRQAMKALVPGLLVFLVSTVIVYLLLGQVWCAHMHMAGEWIKRTIGLWSLISVPVGALLLGFYSHATSNCFTRVVLSVLGIGVGIKLFWIIECDMKRNIQFANFNPVVAHVICINISQAALLIACMTCMVEKLLQEALQKEGNQLAHGTVRNAVCSNEKDQARLLEAIKGNEAQIDTTINVLLKAGKYNKAVASNLARGLSPTRMLHGVSPAEVVAGWCSWVVIVVIFLCQHKLLENNEETWITVLVFMSISSVVVLLTALYLREWAIFATDVLFLGGVVEWILQSLFMVLPELWHGYRHMVVYLIFGLSVLSLFFFYCRKVNACEACEAFGYCSNSITSSEDEAFEECLEEDFSDDSEDSRL